MTTTHAPIFWFAGDDWEIRATLLDENGNPYDLSGTPEIKWALLDGSCRRVIDEADVSISVTDAAAGKCSIMVPSAKTSPLPGARYTDAIRIVTGGVSSTLSTGSIYVTADPWAVQAATVARRPVLRRVS